MCNDIILRKKDLDNIIIIDKTFSRKNNKGNTVPYGYYDKENFIADVSLEILDILRKDNENLNRIIDKIKKNKIKNKFESKNIHNCAIEASRAKMKFMANLYKEKEIYGTLSSKDFSLAAELYHKEKNITRLTHLCKIIYNLYDNKIIRNSDIIFKNFYTFQDVKDYQINYLVSEISKIIT